MLNMYNNYKCDFAGNAIIFYAVNETSVNYA